MRYIKLGNTGLDVSPIALGCMTYGEPERGHPAWSLSEENSRPLIKQAVEMGINLFDTANMYSQGSSEEIVGRALKDFADRDDVVIATKVRHPMRPGPNGAGLSRKAIFAEVDHSLRRLGTDYVDLYQIHRMGTSTPIEETLEALHDVVKAGRARYLGASSMHAWEFSKALHLQRQHGWSRFVSMQDHYNLLAREEEREMLPLCATKGSARSCGARWREAALPARAMHRPSGRPRTPLPTCSIPSSRATAPSSARSRRSPRRAPSAGRRSRWHGCGTTRWSSPRSWARASPLTWTAAVASLEIDLTDDEVAELEAPYTRRADFQGVSDDAELARISAKLGIKPAGS